MVPTATNSIGIVIGVGPNNATLQGGNAIIGYNNQQGIGWAGNCASCYPQNQLITGTLSNFTTGDVIRVRYMPDKTIHFSRAGKFVFSAKLNFTGSVYPTVAMAGGVLSLK
jgi:hypothetical protein